MKAALPALLAALCVANVIVLSQCSTVLLVDTPAGPYIQQDTQRIQWSNGLHRALVSSVMGLQPASPIDTDLSSQIAQLLQPSPFRHPDAYVTVNLLGYDDAGEKLRSIISMFVDGQPVHAFPAADVTSTVALEATLPLIPLNRDTRFSFLGTEYLNQSPVTAEQRLAAVASLLGAKYAPGSEPFTGKLTVGDAAVFDCTIPEDRTFLSEISDKYQELQHTLQHSTGQAVVDVTYTALQGLLVKYGADSPKYIAAVQAAVKVVASVIQQDASRGVIMQVNAVPLKDADMTTITHRVQRTLKAAALSAAPIPDPSEGRARMFSNKAMAYGSFMLLLYFTFAGIYCMCTMKFKKDTLLYASGKAD